MYDRKKLREKHWDKTQREIIKKKKDTTRKRLIPKSMVWRKNRGKRATERQKRNELINKCCGR